MSLLDDLESAPATRPIVSPGQCRMCDILAALPDEEAVAIRDAMTGKLSAEALADVLTRNGHPIGDSTIKRHRRKGHQ